MSTARGSDHRPRQNPTFTGRDLRDEYLLLGPAGDRFHTLNDSARAIYLLCDGTRTLDEIAAALCLEYELTAERARTAVAQAVAELEALGVLLPA